MTRSRPERFLLNFFNAWTRLLLLFPNNIFLLLYIYIYNTPLEIRSSNMVLDHVDPKGMLAVFMQPDSSANEDEYALTLSMTKSL